MLCVSHSLLPGSVSSLSPGSPRLLLQLVFHLFSSPALLPPLTCLSPALRSMRWPPAFSLQAVSPATRWASYLQEACASQPGARSSPRGDPAGWHLNLPLAQPCHSFACPDLKGWEGGEKPPSHQSSSPSLPGLRFAVQLSRKIIAPSPLLLLLAPRFVLGFSNSRPSCFPAGLVSGGGGAVRVLQGEPLRGIPWGEPLDEDKLVFIAAAVRV